MGDWPHQCVCLAGVADDADPRRQLTCVSDGSTATYSGMLPGVLAGQYRRERMEIDLARLCDAAGARLIVGEVTGLDLAGRRLRLASHPGAAVRRPLDRHRLCSVAERGGFG